LSDELQRVIGHLMARISQMERKIERLQSNWTSAITYSLGFLEFVAGLYLREKGLW
jgi:hypothetical protein